MAQKEKKANKSKNQQRTRISDIRRKELTEAALRCIAVKGYDRVTLDDVAKEAGFSQGIALYYFKNREDLLASSIESIWDGLKMLARTVWDIPEEVDKDDEIYEYVRKYFLDKNIDLISVIDNGIDIILNWLNENPHIIAVAMEFWSQVPRNPMIYEVKETIQPYALKTTAIVIQEGIKRGIFKKRDPDLAAHSLISVLSGFAFGLLVTSNDMFNIQDLGKEYKDIVFKYLRQ